MGDDPQAKKKTFRLGRENETYSSRPDYELNGPFQRTSCPLPLADYTRRLPHMAGPAGPI